MHSDVVDLRDFYHGHLGHIAQRTIRQQIRHFWGSLEGQSVLGLGYATPYLSPFRGEAERVLAAMPASQGVATWPSSGPGLTALVEETHLPFADYSIDRVLLVHGLEMTEQLPDLMGEVWRVLAGGGRVLCVVPNRQGIWARIDVTPFGHGQPYSAGQLSRTLRHHSFVPERTRHALFVPPLRSRMLLRSAAAWEQVGHRFFERFAGVILMEASKQLYRVAPTATRRRPSLPRLVPLPSPATSGRALASERLPAISAE
ncbi:MAG: methyltransferase domain-containing protein [Pseudomonadota bacterium]